MAEPSLSIEVAYALARRQRILPVLVPVGTRVREAVRLSSICEQFPGIDPATCTVGVFGHPVDDQYIVRPGDRVEIYRPLAIDPRDARRELAARGLSVGQYRNPTRS